MKITLKISNGNGVEKTTPHESFESAVLSAQKAACLGFGFYEIRDAAGKLISGNW